MISKTKISKRMKKKTDPQLAEAIFLAKKNDSIELARALSISTRKQVRINLEKIEKVKEDVIIVPGKVLGKGEIKKKAKVYALKFSENAENKLKKAGCEFKTISQALKENNKLKGKILRE